MSKDFKEKVFKYIKKEYGAEPEYLWAKFPDYAVLRHDDNKKWFALVASIPCDKLGMESDGEVCIMNVKIDDPVFMDMLLHQTGYFPGYHMNKKNWITVLLDGTVHLKDIYTFIDFSFGATASNKKKEKDRPPKEWVIPANPKYYDRELFTFDILKEEYGIYSIRGPRGIPDLLSRDL